MDNGTYWRARHTLLNVLGSAIADKTVALLGVWLSPSTWKLTATPLCSICSGSSIRLARLAECTAYPTLDSPQIRSQFDMLRRQMSARLGRFKEAFDLKVPANPAQECAGLLRSLAGAYQLEYEDIVRLLSTDEHLAALPVAAAKLLEIEHV